MAKKLERPKTPGWAIVVQAWPVASFAGFHKDPKTAQDKADLIPGAIPVAADDPKVGLISYAELESLWGSVEPKSLNAKIPMLDLQRNLRNYMVSRFQTLDGGPDPGPYQCIYCRELANTKDHVPPGNGIGQTVPACDLCNTYLLHRKPILTLVARTAEVLDCLKAWSPDKRPRVPNRARRIEGAEEQAKKKEHELWEEVARGNPQFRRKAVRLRSEAETLPLPLPGGKTRTPPSSSEVPSVRGLRSGSRLVPFLEELYGIPAGKIRAELRKGGLSKPYTEQEKCFSVLDKVFTRKK